MVSKSLMEALLWRNTVSVHLLSGAIPDTLPFTNKAYSVLSFVNYLSL